MCINTDKRRKIMKFFKFLYRHPEQTCITVTENKNLPTKIVPDKREKRYLEIGPGDTRIDGFEGINIVPNPATDYIADVANGIPCPANVFDIVYSSHFLEHIEWFKTKFVLQEMYRILKKGGRVEIWVPDGLKICKAFVDAEIDGSMDYTNDGWWKFNEKHDPCVWANGRIFTYGNGKVIKGHFNAHLALFSERYLKELMQEVGFTSIRRLEHKECRGADHGWINLGMMGEK